MFTSDPVFKVLYGAQELGSVDQMTFLRHQEDEPTVLSMGGRNWVVTSLDWARRQAFVVPADSRGKSKWSGGKIGMSWRFARAVHDLLTSTSVSAHWTNRARRAFTSLREQYEFLRPEADVMVTDGERDEVRWFTFAGDLVNTALADALAGRGFASASPSDFWIRSPGAIDATRMIGVIRSKTGSELRESFQIANEYLDKLKFSDCLPIDMAHEIVRDRLFRLDEMESTIGRPVIAIST